MIRVLVVDDHVLIRKGIVLLLENYHDVQVVGEASDGAEAITKAISLEPDVILMDVSIPNGLDGFTATQEIHKQLPKIKIIMLTMHSEVAYIQKAIAIEAHGYLLKNSQGGELYEAIQAVISGRLYYNVGIPQEQLAKLFEHKGEENKSILTVREQEIVRYTVLGYTNIQIAKDLFISSKTVENHKANIMQKLKLKNKAELIQYGLRNNYM